MKRAHGECRRLDNVACDNGVREWLVRVQPVRSTVDGREEMKRKSNTFALAGCGHEALILGAALAAGLSFSSSARAALTLTLAEPGAPGGPISITVTDNGA